MTSEETLLITVWGNPETWSPVKKYTVELPENHTHQAEKPYRSTLGPLMEAYEHPKTLLIASSTLEPPSENKTYEEIVNNVKNYISTKIKDKDYCTNPHQVEIQIAPGIGSFRKNQETHVWKGSIEQYTSFTHLVTYNKLMREKPAKIILDLSHGVNYMPTYLRHAIEPATASYILASQKTATLHVYNAAPVTPVDRQTPIEEATIHLVEEKEIDQEDAKKTLYNKLSPLLKPTHQPKPIRSLQPIPPRPHNEQEWIKLLENIKDFVKSAELGLSLPITYLIDEIKNTNIENLLETAEKFAYIKNCSELVEIHGKTLTYKYVLRYEAALSITLANSIKNKNWEENPPYTIEYLTEVSKNYMTLASDKILGHELSQLRDRVGILQSCQQQITKTPYAILIEIGNIKTHDGRKLLDVYRKTNTIDKNMVVIIDKTLKDLRNKSYDQQPDDRNLIAHAGLEQNITRVSVEKGKIRVEYRDDVRQTLRDLVRRL